MSDVVRHKLISEYPFIETTSFNSIRHNKIIEYIKTFNTLQATYGCLQYYCPVPYSQLIDCMLTRYYKKIETHSYDSEYTRKQLDRLKEIINMLDPFTISIGINIMYQHIGLFTKGSQIINKHIIPIKNILCDLIYKTVECTSELTSAAAHKIIRFGVNTFRTMLSSVDVNKLETSKMLEYIHDAFIDIMGAMQQKGLDRSQYNEILKLIIDDWKKNHYTHTHKNSEYVKILENILPSN